MQFNKDIHFGQSARERIIKGINLLEQAVSVTLGPKGRNVVIVSEFGSKPHITKDGVTVAKSIKLRDPLEDLGVQLIKDASEQTNLKGGDGTTTSTVLTARMVNLGIDQVNQGCNPVDIKRGMDIALSRILQQIKDKATPVTDEILERVINISSNGDRDITNVVTKALLHVGDAGSINLTTITGSESTLKFDSGFRYKKGWLVEHFTNGTTEVVDMVNKPLILCLNAHINNYTEVSHIINYAVNANRDLLIVALGVAQQPLLELVSVSRQMKSRLVITTPEGFGDRIPERLYDIATYVGAKVVDVMAGTALENILELDGLGSANHIRVTRSDTVIMGNPNQDKVNARISLAEEELEAATNLYIKQRLKDRISALRGRVATIGIAANSEIELKEKRDRVDDAVAAGRAAMMEGVVAGGGVFLRDLDTVGVRGENEDQQIGINIVHIALQHPYRRILSNAGVTLEENNKHAAGYGCNVATMQWGDVFEMGVIDPALVVRLSVEHSVSIAGMVLTTEASVTPVENARVNAYEQMMAGN